MSMDSLKGMAKKSDKKNGSKKSKVVTLSPDPVKEYEEEWVNAQSKIKEGQAEKEQAEEAILEYAEPEWLEKCRLQGEAENSAAVGRIRLTWKGKSQFASRSTLDADRLQEVFGEEYGHYFTEREGPMRLTEEAVSHPQIVQRLTECIAELAQEFPDVPIVTYDTEVVPKDTLFNDWVLRSDKHEELNSKLRSAGVKQTKVSFSAR